jgi:hypothetical protein
MNATARTLAILATTLMSVAACTSTSTQPGSSSSSAAAAPTANWQEVVKSDTQQVFIDVASLTRTGDVVQASAKTNFVSPMVTAKNEPYLSADNVYRLDCAQRKVALKSIRAYADADLQGKVMQKANFYDNNLQWMDAPQDSVFAHMIDFACEPVG